MDTWHQGTAIKRDNERKRAELRAMRGQLPPVCTMRSWIMLAVAGAAMFLAGFVSMFYWIILS